MAAQITHLVLAKRFIDAHKLIDNQPEFLIGTIFPDIRLFTDIDRTATHVKKVTIDQVISEQDPFYAGLLFHSFVDETREEFMKKNGLYNIVPAKQYIYTQVTKFLEDRFFYPELQSYQIPQAIFNQPLKPELALVSKPEIVMGWHDIILEMISQKPSVDSMADTCYKTGIAEDWINSLKKIYQELENNLELQNLQEKFFRDKARYL